MKPWRSWGEQLQLFKDRGLILSSGDDCLKFLKQVGYYRFSGYCRYFQKSPEDGVNEFISGVTFDQIFEIYSLDQRLHQFLMGPISQIEILLRNRYAYIVAEKGGAYGEYLCDSYFLALSHLSRYRKRAFGILNEVKTVIFLGIAMIPLLKNMPNFQFGLRLKLFLSVRFQSVLRGVIMVKCLI